MVTNSKKNTWKQAEKRTVSVWMETKMKLKSGDNLSWHKFGRKPPQKAKGLAFFVSIISNCNLFDQTEIS